MHIEPGMKLYDPTMTCGQGHVMVVHSVVDGDVVLKYPSGIDLHTTLHELESCEVKVIKPSDIKYVIQVPLDQTIGYLTEEGLTTTVHREAHILDSYEEAIEWGAVQVKAWWPVEVYGQFGDDEIYEVADVSEFQQRPDTW